MEMESKLVPIMREGVDVIKMIFFKRLQIYLDGKYAGRGRAHINQLAGAIINDLFATPNAQEPFAGFLERNRDCIAEEMNALASSLPELCGPLTDALRVQFLCDQQEGIDSTAMLAHAKELKVLILEREVPLPKNFLELVRILGRGLHFLETENRSGAEVTLH
jgi:hypothetical protein